MIDLRRAVWLAPTGLAALAVGLIVAVMVARHPISKSPSPSASTHAVASNTSRTPKVSFGADAVYGAGMGTVVPSPQVDLETVLGNEWRALVGESGRALVIPSGPITKYFELSVVAYAPSGDARLEVVTSSEQRMLQPVEQGTPQVVNLGPLRSSGGRPIGVAFSSIAAHGTQAGPRLILSPIQVEYLAQGQALFPMPALAVAGPEGSRGLSIGAGMLVKFSDHAGRAVSVQPRAARCRCRRAADREIERR